MNPILSLISIIGAKPHRGGTDGVFLQAPNRVFIIFAYFTLELCYKILGGDNEPIYHNNKHEPQLKPN